MPTNITGLNGVDKIQSGVTLASSTITNPTITSPTITGQTTIDGAIYTETVNTPNFWSSSGWTLTTTQYETPAMYGYGYLDLYNYGIAYTTVYYDIGTYYIELKSNERFNFKIGEVQYSYSSGGTYLITHNQTVSGNVEFRFDATSTANPALISMSIKKESNKSLQTGLSFLSNNDLGVAQKYYSYTTSTRTNNTIYTNSTPKPILVMITPKYLADSTLRSYSITIDVVSLSWQMQSNITGTFGTPISFIVPSGSKYSVYFYGGYTSWIELR